ncbi:MAG: hypothetical protein ACFFAH_04730 [Promethearchaeota archaeon]
MENKDEPEKKGYFNSEIKAFILILIGVAARIVMLIYYYHTHIIDPLRSWGDVQQNYDRSFGAYPIITLGLLTLFFYLSFGFFEIFVFWAFFWDLLICMMFYFVLKSFDIKNRNYVFGLFIINPFFFLNNSFSLINCGYHLTDSFFFFFLLIALIYYPKKELYAKYLFYLFLGLSMCAKYYTIPAIGFLLTKYLYEKDWREVKILIICIVPLLLIFIVLPLFYLDYYYKELAAWNELGSYVPIYVRTLPFLFIAILFILLRLKKTDPFEIIFISVIALGTYLFFSYTYLRWFQSVIFYGILKEKEFFRFNLNIGFIKKEINVNNHFLTFYLSFLGVFFSYLIIILVFNNPIY